VQVQVTNTRLGVLTDKSGVFVLRGELPSGRVYVTASLIGFATADREIHIRPGAGVVDIGTISLPARAIELVPPICQITRHRPREAAGKSIEQRRDSLGTYWLLCTEP
jgi:hypothetical protein